MCPMTPGLSVWIDDVREADDEHDAINIEADVEAAIADALTGHPDIPDGTAVSADYHGDE